MAISTDASTQGGSQTTERLARAAHQVVDRVADQAADTEQRLRSRAAETGEQMARRSDEAQRKAEETVQAMRGYVQQHPVATLAIAFTAGVLASTLLRRG